MEHLYFSIKIENVLNDIFPEPAVECIRKYLKLAIDLNGYTNKDLREYIFAEDNNNEINVYSRRKYGKNRSCVSKLKKYQLIHIIHHFNIDIPILRFPRDIAKEICNNLFDKVQWNADHIELFLAEKDKRIDQKSPPIIVSLKDTIHMVKINDMNGHIHTYNIHIQDMTRTHIDCMVVEELSKDDSITYIQGPTFGSLKIKKDLFASLFAKDYRDDGVNILKIIPMITHIVDHRNVENLMKKYPKIWKRYVLCHTKWKIEVVFRSAKRRGNSQSIEQLEKDLMEKWETDPHIAVRIAEIIF